MAWFLPAPLLGLVPSFTGWCVLRRRIVQDTFLVAGQHLRKLRIADPLDLGACTQPDTPGRASPSHRRAGAPSPNLSRSPTGPIRAGWSGPWKHERRRPARPRARPADRTVRGAAGPGRWPGGRSCGRTWRTGWRWPGWPPTTGCRCGRCSAGYPVIVRAARTGTVRRKARMGPAARSCARQSRSACGELIDLDIAPAGDHIPACDDLVMRDLGPFTSASLLLLSCKR